MTVTAHVDTFAHDNLPPRDQWPELLFDLPELQANGEGQATLSAELRGLSVGTGSVNDVVGHSVVIHDRYVVDPRAEFGIPNGRIACGVIQQSGAGTVGTSPAPAPAK